MDSDGRWLDDYIVEDVCGRELSTTGYSEYVRPVRRGNRWWPDIVGARTLINRSVSGRFSKNGFLAPSSRWSNATTNPGLLTRVSVRYADIGRCRRSAVYAPVSAAIVVIPRRENYIRKNGGGRGDRERFVPVVVT